MRSRDSTGFWITGVLCAEIPAGWAFVIETDLFVAMSSKVVTEGVTVGEDEIVIDVGDDDEDRGVVGAVDVHAVVDWKRLKTLSQVAQVDVLRGW